MNRLKAANAITSSRIVFALLILFAPVFSVPFYVFYFLGAATESGIIFRSKAGYSCGSGIRHCCPYKNSHERDCSYMAMDMDGDYCLDKTDQSHIRICSLPQICGCPLDHE